jgi:hypothetical protein
MARPGAPKREPNVISKSKVRRSSTEERIAYADAFKEQIRRNEPGLKAEEVQRRAELAAGLSREGDRPSAKEAREAMDTPGGRPRAAARRAGGSAQRLVTSSSARKVVFGVMAFSLIVGVLRDIRSGRAITTDIVPRRVIGTLIGTFLLMILAGPLPRVARGLAILVGFSVIAFNQTTVELIAGQAGPEEGFERGLAEAAEVAQRHADMDRARHSGPGGPAKRAASGGTSAAANTPT